MTDHSFLELPLEWAAWTLENLIRGVSTQEVCDVLTKAGFVDFVKPFGEIEQFDDSVAARRTIRNLLSYREVLLRKLKLRVQGTSTIIRRPFDPKIFYENFYRLNEPVILTGLIGEDSALSKWSPDYLKGVFGGLVVEVQRGREKDPEYELNLDNHRTKILLGEFVDLVQSSGPNNDAYMCANNRTLDNDLTILFEDISPMPNLLDPSKAKNQCFMWFGPEGTITPFHYDLMNVLLYQVYGEKQFVLAPPEATPFMYNDVGVFSKVDYFGDHSMYPLFDKVPLIVDTLNPREALFIPVGWWHAIRAKSTSISLSFTNFVQDNDFRKISC
jgi:Cupin-like domain